MPDGYAGIIPPGPQARVVKLARMLGPAAACVPMLRATSCVMHPADPVEAKIKRAPDVAEIEHSTAIVQRSSADYYALIARALEHLKENTSESRRSIYAHAETQLVRELRALDPPLPEAEITSERLSRHAGAVFGNRKRERGVHRRGGAQHRGRDPGCGGTAADAPTRHGAKLSPSERADRGPRGGRLCPCARRIMMGGRQEVTMARLRRRNSEAPLVELF
jgi:hypothetical protein